MFHKVKGERRIAYIIEYKIKSHSIINWDIIQKALPLLPFFYRKYIISAPRRYLSTVHALVCTNYKYARYMMQCKDMNKAHFDHF